MILVYVLLVLLSLVMVAATVCSLFRVGEKEEICKYDYDEK